jgi:hypothetical protein
VPPRFQNSLGTIDTEIERRDGEHR